MKRLAALLLAGLAGAASTSAPAETCKGPTCNLDTLAPYFAKAAVARGSRHGPPVHILQIGDSHTAGDAVTGAWRDLLQMKLGGGGRGVLAPGRPYDGYLTHGITASMSAGWSIAATFGKNAALPRPLLGLSGFSVTSTRPGATMGLHADSAAMAFDSFTLCAIAGPSAGGVAVSFDGVSQARLDFTSLDIRPMCQTLRAESPRMAVEITAEQPGLILTSWATFRNGGGVALSNVGVVGSQLVHFARTDDGVVAEEFRAYAPDLIVLAFGTNEGFSPRFDPSAYEETLRSQIARLRRLGGNVPILMLGAPDALSRINSLRSNAAGSPIECEQATPDTGLPDTPATPASDPLAATMTSAGVTQAQPESPLQVQPLPPTATASAAPRLPLFAPPGLAAVRRIQRRVAGELGVAYWDWQARMGGPCAAKAWVQRPVPLMRGDYVHFKTGGGIEIARRLQADLDRAAQSAR